MIWGKDYEPGAEELRKHFALITHVLLEGRARCGLPGVPSEWPEEHNWVAIYGVGDPSIDRVSCMTCRCLVKMNWAMKALRPRKVRRGR